MRMDSGSVFMRFETANNRQHTRNAGEVQVVVLRAHQQYCGIMRLLCALGLVHRVGDLDSYRHGSPVSGMSHSYRHTAASASIITPLELSRISRDR